MILRFNAAAAARCSDYAKQGVFRIQHYANRPGGAERPRLPLCSPHAASLRTSGPNRRERNFLIRSAIILLAVDGNLLSLPAAIWSQASANLNLSIIRRSCSARPPIGDLSALRLFQLFKLAAFHNVGRSAMNPLSAIVQAVPEFIRGMSVQTFPRAFPVIRRIKARSSAPVTDPGR